MATLRPKVSMSDPRHILRYLRREAGLSEADIAKAERVSIQTVRQSIREVEAYRMMHDKNEFDFSVRELVIGLAPKAKQSLGGLLEATELVEFKDEKTGKVKVVETQDKTTRLEANRVFTSLILGLQPKAPLMNQQINNSSQAAAVAAAAASASSSETHEERMRRLRQKAAEHNLLPPVVAGVPDRIDAGDGDDDDEEEED